MIFQLTFLFLFLMQRYDDFLNAAYFFFKNHAIC